MTMVLAPEVNARVISALLRGKSGSILAGAEQPQKTALHQIGEGVKISQEDRPSGTDTDFVDIPLIDLSLIETDRAGLVREVGNAARQWGICRLVNHGIPADLMKEIEVQGLKFFGKSEEEKLKLQNRENGRWYYKGNNTEEKSHSLHWAESFVMRLGKWTALDLDVLKQATSEWPTDDEFRKALLEYVNGLNSMAEKFLQLAAESLGLHSDYYSGPALGSGSLGARWNYFPACQLPADVLGAHSHTDPNFLTLLQNDSVGGLQVEKDGRWYNVRQMEGTLIVNIADLFQIWSNGIFKSVLHRVLVNKEVSRFSVAWVFHLHIDESLSAPGELVNENYPRLYRDITAKEYFQKMMLARMESRDYKVFDGSIHMETLKI